MKTENEVIYMIDKAGKLFRKGEHIGDMEDGTMRLLPEKKSHTAAVTRWLCEEADAEAKRAESGNAPAPLAEAAQAEDGENGALASAGLSAVVPKKPTPAEQEVLDKLGLDKESREQVVKARAIHQDDLDFAARTGCPPPPKKNPQYGDKTPAFVEWLHKHRHDQFVIRYGVTGKGKVAVVQPNPHTGIEEVTGYRETYFALRKTHLTERDSSRDGLSEDMDWNA